MENSEARDGESKNGQEPTDEVELFIRAGENESGFGACPMCQRVFMVLLTKANYGTITLTVTTINMSKPPADFKKMANRLPAMVHGNEVFTDPFEIIQHIDECFHAPPLMYDNVKAANASKDVFSKFSFYLKDVKHSPSGLLAELSKMDSYLNESPHLFLCRDVPDHLDCIMLPKLQHMRVAAKAFKDFDIPAEFKGLWRYLHTGYNCDVFVKTCPSDQEIVHHWQNKPEVPLLNKAKRAFYSIDSEPRYSFDIPEGILD